MRTVHVREVTDRAQGGRRLLAWHLTRPDGLGVESTRFTEDDGATDTNPPAQPTWGAWVASHQVRDSLHDSAGGG